MRLYVATGRQHVAAAPHHRVPVTPDWPPPYGIIMHPYEEWIELAMKANYHVRWQPGGWGCAPERGVSLRIHNAPHSLARDTCACGGRFQLALLPLDDAHSAAFNETAFWQWFETVKGMPCKGVGGGSLRCAPT